MATPIFPYQDIGAQTLASNDRYGLHDEMGIGKTCQAIRAIDYIGARRGIVVAPAIGRAHWFKEFRKFSDRNILVCKGETRHDFIAWLRGKYGFLVTSYEMATKWAQEVQNSGELLQFVVLDEGHYLKNTDAKRTRAILGRDLDCTESLTGLALNVWHLTGTPMFNDPLDVYPFLRMCRAMPLSKTAFTQRYFHKHATAFSLKTRPKPEMVNELRTIIQNNSIRRTQAEVGLQLPPIFIQQTEIDGDTDAIKKLLYDHPGLDRAVVDALERGGLSFLEAQHISTLRRLIGEAKAIPYAQMLLEELQSYPEKRVVFGVHIDALVNARDYLRRHGINCVSIQGSNTDKEKLAAEETFQNDPRCLVILGNIKAMGTVITLTAARRIDLMESEWSPGANAQAIKRVRRIGQTSTVFARFIALANSLDTTVIEIVAGKTASIAQIDSFAMDAAPVFA